MTADDKTLTEQIAYAVHDMRVVDKHPGDDNHPFNIAAAVLPIIRKAQADAWQAGVNFALPSTETTHIARHNPHRTQEAR